MYFVEIGERKGDKDNIFIPFDKWEYALKAVKELALYSPYAKIKTKAYLNKRKGLTK